MEFDNFFYYLRELIIHSPDIKLPGYELSFSTDLYQIFIKHVGVRFQRQQTLTTTQ